MVSTDPNETDSILISVCSSVVILLMAHASTLIRNLNVGRSYPDRRQELAAKDLYFRSLWLLDVIWAAG